MFHLILFRLLIAIHLKAVVILLFTLAEGAEEGIGGGRPEARLAGARVPAGHVDTLGVSAAAVEAGGTLVHVELARRSGKT